MQPSNKHKLCSRISIQMKFLQLFILLVFLTSSNAFSQKVIKHPVTSGESIYSIAKKYHTTEAEIFEANPKLKGKVLALKTIVQIPNKDYKPKEKTNKKESDSKKESKQFKDKKEQITKIVTKSETQTITNQTETKEAFESHIVLPKEKLYSLSKKYNVTMETICELNPDLKTGNLKIGVKLKLPLSNEKPISQIHKENSKIAV